MAHKTLIGGTTYDITGGKAMVSGTAYSIAGGKTMVSGTAYDISLSNLGRFFLVDIHYRSSLEDYYPEYSEEQLVAASTLTFQFEKGMTWNDFCNSTYDVVSVFVDRDVQQERREYIYLMGDHDPVYSDYGGALDDGSGNTAFPSDLIISGHTYYAS